MTARGSTLFEVDNKRLETEYEYMQSTNTPKTVEEQEETLPEEQQEAEEEQIKLVAPAQQQNHIFAKAAIGKRRKKSSRKKRQNTTYLHIKRFLFEQEEELAEYEACEGLPARMVLRKRMIVDALKILLASHEDQKRK